jgi:60 kDa SS-A/Ro ribonucleoprotein
MAVNYAKQFSTRNSSTPQTKPMPGTAQVQNSAGGYSFEVDQWTQLDRFLILGAEGGTYYVSQADLIKRNHDKVIACIKEDGVRVVNRTVEISDAGRAIKNDPAIFVLALVTAHGSPEAKAAAYANLSKVCRIGTHLFHFAAFVNELRGWGSGLRKAVGRWYIEKDVDHLAMQAIKYQSRDGWSHSDLLRKAHPVAADKKQDAIFRWMVGGADALGKRTIKRKNEKDASHEYGSVKRNLPELIEAFEQAKTADTKTLVKLITENDLPREAVPTEKLNEIAVWEALLQKMPMTATVRNLNKMTAIGLIKPLSEATVLVRDRLLNKEQIKKSRIHPMQLLIALKMYSQGRGDKGSLTWSPVPQITQALDEAFYLAFGNVVPTGKPLLFGLDVSGSMGSPVSGCPVLSCAEATGALSLIHANVEPNMHIMGFANNFVDLGVRKGMSLPDVMRRIQGLNFGSTDCSLPMEWAIQNKVKVGGFVVMTDNETYAGNRHPMEALKAYRKAYVNDARLIVVSMTANPFSIADGRDKYCLDVVGFDTETPTLISDFIRED